MAAAKSGSKGVISSPSGVSTTLTSSPASRWKRSSMLFGSTAATERPIFFRVCRRAIDTSIRRTGTYSYAAQFDSPESGANHAGAPWPMVILRRTQRLARVLSTNADAGDASDTALGDWYVNRLVVDRRP